MDDEKRLVTRMRAGDGEAMRALVGCYHRPLFAFVYRLTDDHALADDVVQETFIRMTRQGGIVPDNLRAWLFTVARNLVYDYFRSAAYRREQMTDFAHESETLAVDDGMMEQMAMAADQRADVVALLHLLSTPQREVVILRFYHDMPLHEIAEVMGAPLGTVKSRLFLALRRLKEGLQVKGVVHE